MSLIDSRVTMAGHVAMRRSVVRRTINYDRLHRIVEGCTQTLVQSPGLLQRGTVRHQRQLVSTTAVNPECSSQADDAEKSA